MVKTRVVFLGTPEFAVPSFRALLDSPDFEVVGAVTQKDRPAGRGQRLTPPPVKRLALERGVALLQPERIRGNPEAADFLRRTAPDLLAVVAFGQLLPRSFFEAPPGGALNVHASLLPKYRGAAPIVHALLAGETETGVTIMKIDEGLDTGDTLARRSVPVNDAITAGELESLLAVAGAQLLVETIRPYLRGDLVPRPQDGRLASHAGRIDKAEARLDWSRPAAEIHNRIRAFNPWPTAFTTFRGGPLKLWRSWPRTRPPATSQAPGTILGLEGERLWVACGESSLAVLEVQPASRNRMSVRDFVNGFAVTAGEVFH